MLAAPARLRAACSLPLQRTTGHHLDLAAPLPVLDCLVHTAFAGRKPILALLSLRPSGGGGAVPTRLRSLSHDPPFTWCLPSCSLLAASHSQHCRSVRPPLFRSAHSRSRGQFSSMADLAVTAPVGEDEELVLAAAEDRYDGLIVSELPEDPVIFSQRLETSICRWKAQGKKGVWLKVPLSQVDLVPIAVKAGFGFHHADPGYCMLTLWLPSAPSTLPANASHQVGVGAFLLNQQGEVLAVQEKNGPLRGTGLWKLPTGLANQGEDLHDAAIREVKEETGIDAEFQEVLLFRQAHGIAHGKSDLFFVCALRPTTFDITPQESEIADAKWMPLDIFCKQPFFTDRPVFRNMMDVCRAYAEGRYTGLRQMFLGQDSQFQMYAGIVGQARY